MSCRLELYVSSFFKEIGQYMLNAWSWNPIIFRKNVCEYLVLVKVCECASFILSSIRTFSMQSQVFIRSTCIYSKVTLISYLTVRRSYLRLNYLLLLPIKFSRSLYFLGISVSLGLSTCHFLKSQSKSLHKGLCVFTSRWGIIHWLDDASHWQRQKDVCLLNNTSLLSLSVFYFFPLRIPLKRIVF